jgi:hypothetical protein
MPASRRPASYRLLAHAAVVCGDGSMLLYRLCCIVVGSGTREQRGPRVEVVLLVTDRTALD